jgi:hypothetical protein
VIIAGILKYQKRFKMSTYREKEITFHLVSEFDQDFDNRWIEVRCNDNEIGRGDTLKRAIESVYGNWKNDIEWEDKQND